MSKIQRYILIVGCITVAALCAFPPWGKMHRYKPAVMESGQGHRFILVPPAQKYSSYTSKIDVVQLLIEIGCICGLTGASFFIVSLLLPQVSNEVSNLELPVESGE